MTPHQLRARATVIEGTHSPASFARCLSIPLAELAERAHELRGVVEAIDTDKGRRLYACRIEPVTGRRLWPSWGEILGNTRPSGG